MLSYRQHAPSSCEAGGVLLGRLIRNSCDAIVDEGTSPTPQDHRGRFFFRRAGPPTQRRITEAWFQSEGVVNYLGEWHTHPEDVPSPSSTDLKNWRKLVRTARFEQDSLIFVIVGL